MQTNLKLNNCFETALPAPNHGFKNKIFRRIRPDGLDDRDNDANSIFDATRAIREAEAKQALAELASNMKSEFLTNISHEIRTPMGAIIGLAQIMLRTKLDDKQTQCMMVLQSSAEALMVMVEDLLDIGKIESGTIDLKQAPFNMAALLEQIVGIMSVKAQEKGIGLTLQCEAGVSKFIGDSGRIRQIIMNLVGNAIKFTSAGEVTVIFAEGGIEKGKKKISIAVTDTGIGIPQDKIDMIFGRFVQADCSIVRKFGGTGLGLAISKALAENMGGTIIVSSIVDKGSTFTFHLGMPEEEGTGMQETVIYLDTVARTKQLRLAPQLQ